MPLNEYLGYDYFYLELFSKESSSEEPLIPHRKLKNKKRRLQTDSLNGVYV
jgi:hypothetical protein